MGLGSAKRLSFYVHLRVEDAGRRLNNANRLVICRKGIEGILVVLDNGNELETHILGVHLGGEGVRDGFGLAGGDLGGVAGSGQVAQDDRLRTILNQGAANDRDTDGLRLLVGDGEDSLSLVAIDQLDAEDLGLRERGADGDFDVGSLALLIHVLNNFGEWLAKMLIVVRGLMSWMPRVTYLLRCEGAKRSQGEQK